MKFFRLLVALSLLASAASAALTRGPYLQDSTTNSIVIRWRTSTAETGRVLYGTNLTVLNLTNSIVTNGTEHIVKLTGLQLDTKYFYAIGATNTLLAGPVTNQFFLTHPAPGTPKPIRVWVIGDAGTATANQIAVRNAFETWNGTNTLHAWLQLGDNAYNSGLDSEYQSAVFNIYTNELRTSVTWPTLGNHETVQSTTFVDTYPYFDIFTLPTAGEAGGVPSGTEHWYSFDLGMVHFICLDSMTADRATNGAMATWLRSDLAVNTARWTVAFWHHPPYSRGSHDSDVGGTSYDTQMGQMRTNFLPILENGGVDLVFCGHSHAYERSKLISGHYGLSGTFSSVSHVIQAGSGRETNGLGAFHKPDGLGEQPVGNRGTVYTVAGSSGQATTGTINHPAMFYSALNLGSVVLDFRTNRLDVIFIRETGATDDYYTVIKDGTYPPEAAAPIYTNGNFQITVATRAYRTNVLETSTNLVNWTPRATNFTTATNVIFTLPAGGSGEFIRVKRP
jgi:hypothetical protein